jgi:hypothetical protein
MIWELGEVKRRERFRWMEALTQQIPNWALFSPFLVHWLTAFFKKWESTKYIRHWASLMIEQWIKYRPCIQGTFSLVPQTSPSAIYPISIHNTTMYPFHQTDNLKIICDSCPCIQLDPTAWSILPFFFLATFLHSRLSYLIRFCYNNCC